MSLDAINAATAVATLFMLAASVFTAVMQLRHMRASNELEAVLAIENDFRSPDLQDALRYVQSELPERLRDAAYCVELRSSGYVDPRRHPEMRLCNWFNRTGALVQGGFLNENMFLDSFGRLLSYYWRQLGPVVALRRQVRGSGQYESFEYLVQRAKLRTQHRRYPANAKRLPIVDRWLESDPKTTV